jgi:hypothetical protein
MRNLIAIILILGGVTLTNTAWATSYALRFKARIGSRKPLQGRLTVLENQEGIVSTKDTVIKMIPSEAGHDAIKVKIEAYRKTSSGLQKISNPVMILQENKPSSVTDKTEDGVPVFGIELTSKRVR